MSHATMLKHIVRQSLSSSDQEALLQEMLDMTSEGMYEWLFIQIHALGTLYMIQHGTVLFGVGCPD